MRTRQVLSIIYRKNNIYEFLLLKRIPDKGGFWQPPSGGIEGDESILEACYREIQEETGITREKIIKSTESVHCFVIDRHYITDEKIAPTTEYACAFEVKNDIKITLDANVYPEHEEYRWVTYEQAMKMLKWQNNKDAFIKLKKILGQE
ncbi:NUDIX pyrophosphatase [candidate division KSB1 bacterium]